MRVEESKALLDTMEAAYRITLEPTTRSVYSEFLRTIDFQVGKTALSNAIAQHTFCPSVAELRTQVKELDPGDDVAAVARSKNIEYVMRRDRISHEEAKKLVVKAEAELEEEDIRTRPRAPLSQIEQDESDIASEMCRAELAERRAARARGEDPGPWKHEYVVLINELRAGRGDQPINHDEVLARSRTYQETGEWSLQ